MLGVRCIIAHPHQLEQLLSQFAIVSLRCIYLLDRTAFVDTEE